MKATMKGRGILVLAAAVLVSTVCVAGIRPIGQEVTVLAAKKDTAAVKKIQVGGQLQLASEGRHFRSSDSTVAAVSADGRVTGKKKGTATITAGAGTTQKKYKIRVRDNKRGISLPVSPDEVKLVNPRMKTVGGKTRLVAKVKNLASRGRIKRIEYIYTANVAPETVSAQTESGSAENRAAVSEQTVVLSAKNIGPGKTSGSVSCPGDVSGKLSDMKLQKVRLYTGDALCTWKERPGRISLSWGGADTKAPVISGWVGKGSYDGKEVYRICYADRQKTYSFKEFVEGKDDRDGSVKLKVDTSKINWKKDGIYKVYYTASDKAGNVARKWAKVRVIVPAAAERVADSVLKTITKKNWSDERKARAIYRYVKQRASYVDNGTHSDWRKVALNGIRYQSGDCYTYYSMARLLLTRAGIFNMEVTRYPAYTGYHHWWNLVYIRGGWYHLDTTPRQHDAQFCLMTDAQLKIYSTGSTFRFQEKKYPERATKKISPNPKPRSRS